MILAQPDDVPLNLQRILPVEPVKPVQKLRKIFLRVPVQPGKRLSHCESFYIFYDCHNSFSFVICLGFHFRLIMALLYQWIFGLLLLNCFRFIKLEKIFRISLLHRYAL